MPGELQQLSRSDELLSHKHESGGLSQFIQSAAYSGLEAPVRAVAQVVDHVVDNAHHIGADAAVKSTFKNVGIEQPTPAEFGTKSWYAQSLGSAVGMIAPFLAMRGAVSAVATHAFGAEALSGAQTMGRMAAQEAMLSGTTGLVYGSLLTPSKESNVGSWSFVGDRVKTGLGDMVTFAALGFSSPYMSKGLDSLAASAERSSLSPLAASMIGNTLRSPFTAGLVSGIPSGIVSAEVSAIQQGKPLPTVDELKQGIVGMMFVGGAFGAASSFASRFTSSNETKVVEAKADQKGQAFTPGLELVDAKSIAAARERVEAAVEQGRSFDTDDLRIALSPSPKDVAAKVEPLVADNAPNKPRLSFVNKDDAALAAVGDKIKVNDNPNLPGFEVVLGASGVEAPAHVGFLKALEDHHVKIDKITGASGGSVIATFYANGYTPKQISQILLSSEFRSPSFDVLAKCFHMQDPWNLFPYAIDFKPWLQDLVDRYKLKPQDNLRIVAADAETHAPVVFEGKNMNLVDALTASTAATPALGMKPIYYQGRQLVDGFYYHPIPAALTKGPALVSKIGFVSKLPTEMLSPWDYMMHLKEMNANAELSARYPDPPGHIIATTGLPDVATTTFGVSLETLKKLIVHGEEATNERLSQPDAVAVLNGKKPS